MFGISWVVQPFVAKACFVLHFVRPRVFACHLAFVGRFVRDGVFCSAFSSETMNILTRVGRFVWGYIFNFCCVYRRRSVNSR